MSETVTVGLDLAKNVFVASGTSSIQAHGAEASGRAFFASAADHRANSVIIKRHGHAAARQGTWLGGMLMRKPPMLVRNHTPRAAVRRP